MNSTISIHDLEPAEIVSTEVDLDDPELETLFLRFVLRLCVRKKRKKTWMILKQNRSMLSPLTL